nr:MAG TPA: hypothetical protein [Caudoviricetes sp.]
MLCSSSLKIAVLISLKALAISRASSSLFDDLKAPSCAASLTSSRVISYWFIVLAPLGWVLFCSLITPKGA